MNQPKQRLLPFNEVTIDAVAPPPPLARNEPREDAVAAFSAPRGPRGPETDLAEETLRAVEKAMIERKNGWFHVTLIADFSAVDVGCPDYVLVA